MMNALLKKEMRLSASILSYLFLGFSLMALLPGYPILCGVFRLFRDGRADDRAHDGVIEFDSVSPECFDERQPFLSRNGPADFRHVQSDFYRWLFQDRVQVCKAFCDLHHCMFPADRSRGSTALCSRARSIQRFWFRSSCSAAVSAAGRSDGLYPFDRFLIQKSVRHL